MTKKKADAMVTSSERKEAEALAELTDYFDNEVSVDGMGDVGGADIRLASKVFNLSGKDASSGVVRSKDKFFDNVTEEQQDSLDCVLLLTMKTHLYQTFNNATRKNDTICSSLDRKLGILRETSAQRQCKGCPDFGWFKDEASGERKPKCGDSHTVVCVEDVTNRPFTVRFKRTALKSFRAYLMQHHWGARQKADGTRGNIPLFAFRCRITLEMHESGNYAMPTFKRGDVLSRDEVMAMHESAKHWHDMMHDVMSVADTADEKHAGNEEGTTSDDFADDFADGADGAAG